MQPTKSMVEVELEGEVSSMEAGLRHSVSESNVPVIVPSGPQNTSGYVRSEIRRVLALEYRKEILGLLRSRYWWKRSGDVCEALAKVMTGVGSVLAFAASAEKDADLTDVLAFVAGSVGTMGLVLHGYAAYAGKESRTRTGEMNNILRSLGVTPMPDITLGTRSD